MTNLWKALHLPCYFYLKCCEALMKRLFRVRKLRGSLQPEHEYELSASRHRLQSTVAAAAAAAAISGSCSAFRLPVRQPRLKQKPGGAAVSSTEPPQITILQSMRKVGGRGEDDEYANSFFKYRGKFIYRKKNTFDVSTQTPVTRLKMKRAFIIPAPFPASTGSRATLAITDNEEKEREHCSAVKNASRAERENIWRCKDLIYGRMAAESLLFFLCFPPPSPPFRRSHRWGFGGRALSAAPKALSYLHIKVGEICKSISSSLMNTQRSQTIIMRMTVWR